MVVCRNWTGVPGSCRFNERCRFDHPEPERGNRNNNSFAPLQDNRSNSRSNNAPAAPTSPFSLSKEQIITDLSNERPQWILSAYGPGRQAPAQLFGGPQREQSFEEMRLLHRLAQQQGNTQQAITEAQQLFQLSEQQIQTALGNIDAAVQYIISAEGNHPNRLDTVRSCNADAPRNANVFAYGQDSPALQQSSGGVFGAPSQPAAPTSFGGAGTAATSAFGQPSQPGGQGVFGAPSQPTTGGAFGQPAAPGQRPNPFDATTGVVQPGNSLQPPQGTSTFGAPSQPTSGFGAPPQPASSNPFGAPSQPASSNPFGAPSQPAKNAFDGVASSPSGAPSPARPNPFVTPSQPAIPTMFSSTSQPAPSGFGAPSQPTTSNQFAAASQPARTAFGQVTSSPFSAPSPARPNPFAIQNQHLGPSQLGTAPSQAAASNPPAPAANNFGGTSSASANMTTGQINSLTGPQPNSNATANPSGQPSNGHVLRNGNSLPVTNIGAGMSSADIEAELSYHPPLNSYATHTNGMLTVWKGRSVEYREKLPGFKADDGIWTRIWFPDGPPPRNTDTEMADDLYDEETKLAYLHRKRTGRFPAGSLPFLPPKQAWNRYDM